jgi:hypothetical protein
LCSIFILFFCFQLLEEEDTFPDDFIISIEAMLAALHENTEKLFSESLSKLNKVEAMQ